MESNLRTKISGYLKELSQRSRQQKIMAVLACVVVAATFYALILPAVTMTKETICGMEEHTHSDACYTVEPAKPQFLCQALQAHGHTAACWGEDNTLTCGQAEVILHTHGDLCYSESGELLCPLAEQTPHTPTAPPAWVKTAPLPAASQTP